MVLVHLIFGAAAWAHQNLPFEVRGPAGTQYSVSSENGTAQTGTIPASGSVSSTVEGYHVHDGDETLTGSFTDGMGTVACAPVPIGVYEPAWHFKTSCVATFTFDPGPRTCASTCPVRAPAPPPPSSVPKAFPNPLRVGQGGDAVKFKNFPARATVRIYGTTGRLVWEGTTGPEGDLHWHLEDRYGTQAGTGVYRAVCESGGDRRSVLFAIQR